ncbi:MAG TPA: methyltransferase [Actinocrinis sp.]|nr:methyltransferase [Actinocrinis sp.]
MNRVTTSLADLQLARYPEPKEAREPLRAWDAADEYLLRHVTGTVPAGGGPDPARAANAGPVDLSGTVVVLGDRWGALVTALAEYGPVQVTDSYLTQLATRANLARNGVPGDAVRLASTTDEPPERIDVLLVRIPKSLALLEDQLTRLARHIHPGTVVAGAGMVTEIHTSTLNLFERIIGPTRTSLAVRKGRLIFSVPDPDRIAPATQWPRTFSLPADVGLAAGRTVVNHGGVFAGERLDVGARFFLRHLPWEPGTALAPGRRPTRIADLGCGNGVLGLAASLAHPDAEVVFVDESYQALASARSTMLVNGLLAGDPGAGSGGAGGAAEGGPGPGAPGAGAISSTLGPDFGRGGIGRARFLLQDGLSGVPADSFDLVLNNPPFHTHQTTTDMTAWRMFNDSKAALRPGGELWAVGNRHLGYHVKLRRVFGNSELVASDAKFVVLRAVKEPRG